MVDDARNLDLAEAMRAAVGTFVRRTRQGSGTASDARIDILGQLERSDRPLSAATLARLRGVTHQSARAQLVGLAADGLVAGTPDPLDARAVLFTPTVSGHQALKRSRAARSAWLAEGWIAQLSPGERQALRVVILAMGRLDHDKDIT